MQGGDRHYPRCSEAAKAAGGDLTPSVPAPRAPVWDEAWANSASCHTQPPHNALPLTQQRGRGGSRTPLEPTTTRQGPSAAPPEAGPAGGEAGAGLRARLPGLQPPGCHGYGPPAAITCRPLQPPAVQTSAPHPAHARRRPRPPLRPAALSMRSGPARAACAAGRWRAGREGGGWGGDDGGRRLRAAPRLQAAPCCPPSATCGWRGWYGRVPGGSRGMRPAGGRVGAWRKRDLKRREKSAGEKWKIKSILA